MFSSSSALQLRENTGSWKLKSTFGCCRFEYIKMMHGDASLWESFPQALERPTGARRYVGAFRAPFQDLHLAPSQEHALRVCSLLAIPPPPPDQKALPGGVPEDLSEDNLSTWANTVQDVATGMIVPQPGTDQIIFPHLVELLTLLESVSRVAFCRQCYLPGSACRCLETSCGAKSQIQPSAPTRRRLGEALDRRFHMDLHPWQVAPFGICLLRITQDSLGHLLLFANPAPLLGELLFWKASSWPCGMD